MGSVIKTDLCVIGAGSGGLSVAAGAAQMGADVVLIEKGLMGGDCLNFGCVPSKALLAAGHVAEVQRTGARFGVSGGSPTVDFAAVNDHVKGVIAAIAPHDSEGRFESLGVKVIKAASHFTNPREVAAGDVQVRAKRFVIATGSSPAVPQIAGLSEVPFFTNETIFELRSRPDHLIIIGGGPIGAELAQAHRRLGAQVTILEMFEVLGKDDPEIARFAKDRLVREGISLREGMSIVAVEQCSGGVAVRIGKDNAEERLEGSHLLVAAGRSPNVEGLGLEAARISYTRKGIEVDARLRTSNKKIFAVGDVVGGYQFTHMASYHAGIVIRNALFFLPARVDHRTVPWVTFTDPEIAHVGLTEAHARQRYGDRIKALRWSFAENDRAQTERETEGLIKVVVDRSGRVLGTSIAGPHAGELLQPWCLAISRKLKISAMANLIVPYPTLGEVNKRVAGSYYTDSLFSARTRKIVHFLQRFA